MSRRYHGLKVKSKASLLLGALLMPLALGGCAVSQQQTALCEKQGGHVTDKTYHVKGSGWSSEDSGSLYACTLPDGKMREVYNDPVTQIKAGWWNAPNDDNRKVFDLCQAQQGEVYETSYMVGKVNEVYWLCVKEGEVLQLLS